MWMDEIIRICLPFMGAFDLTDDNYRLLARRISDAPQGHSCLLNPKVHVSPCDYFWLHRGVTNDLPPRTNIKSRLIILIDRTRDLHKTYPQGHSRMI